MTYRDQGSTRRTLGVSARPRRPRRDEGATLVEAAIILPLLFALLFGVIEIGGALKSYSGTSNAVRAGGRMASVAGNDAMADQAILERVAREAAGLGAREIEYVILWKADSSDDTVPSGCIAAAGSATTANTSSVGVYDGGNGSVNGACNVYIRPQNAGAAFDMAQGEAAQPRDYYFGCTSTAQSGTKLDCNWSPKNRKVVISPRGTPAANALRPDYLGVYIRASHRYYTGILGNTLTITETGINLLEPDAFGVDD